MMERAAKPLRSGIGNRSGSQAPTSRDIPILHAFHISTNRAPTSILRRRRGEMFVDFACLLFDAAREVKYAEIISAPQKALALEAVAARMAYHPDVTGFQLWRAGDKVAEQFETTRRKAEHLTGPLPALVAR